MTATASDNNNKIQAAPDCWPCRAQSYAVLACLLRVSDEAVQHDYTKQPHRHSHSHIRPSWTGPPSDRQPSSTSTPCCTAFSSGIHRSRGSLPPTSARSWCVASYSILPRPGASSAGNIPCLARLSRGIGSAIPANSACCSCCSFPDSREREPATRLSIVARPSHPTKSATQLAACSLHLDPALPYPQSGAIATKNISTQELCLCR
jgi:hypothetical protein